MLRLEKTGTAPRAALRFALGYLIMPLWGGGSENPGTVRLHHFME